MRLVINIPCYNEERTLGLVLREIPKEIEGVSEIIVQVVDDGSRDRTVEIARRFGCVVVRHKRNLGLGRAFKTGVVNALELGCDLFVNTDGDNQYPSRYISYLVQPIIKERADMVIGNRIPWKVKHFSPLKRFFQYFGNHITRSMAGINVPDTVSGFRAYSKEALLRINVISRFSYVLDTILQASRKGLKVVSIPIKINRPTRRSRLFKSMFEHIKKSGANIVRMYIIYEPFKSFLMLSLIFFTPGIALVLRFFYYYFNVSGQGKIQSLIIAAILFVLGSVTFSLGVIADLIGVNRALIEEELYLSKKRRYRDSTKFHGK